MIERDERGMCACLFGGACFSVHGKLHEIVECLAAELFKSLGPNYSGF